MQHELPTSSSIDPFARQRMELLARLRVEHSTGALPSLPELADEIAELRPLPVVATRVLELSEEDRFSAHELATVISSDQALTITLLRLANSAFYGYARRVTTVRDAVVLLGFRTVRSAVLTACLLERRAPECHIDHAAFWQHSIAVGLLAETLAHDEGARPDHAFTGGVLHNTGILALDQHRPDLLGPALIRVRDLGISRAEALRGLLGFSDTELGAALGERWNFPPELVETVRMHWNSLESGSGPLPRCVARARLLVRAYGLGDGVGANVGTRPEPVPEAVEEPERTVLASSLEQAGGMEQVMERVDAFLAASLR